MAFIGFLVAVALFFHFKRRLQYSRSAQRSISAGASAASSYCDAAGGASARDHWQRHWADKFERQAARRASHVQAHAKRHLRKMERYARRYGMPIAEPGTPEAAEAEALWRAHKRANSEVGFYIHLMCYLGVTAFLALINLMTTGYPWFLWPAMGWGIGLFSHYMATFGRHMARERFFQPAIERELRREKIAMNTEKQASIEELSATIAHEIRNPIAAAKSLVQQMGEDPHSVENVEYAKVALEELDRVERRISHLLKYAKEEEYSFDHVNLAAVVDSALTQLKSKLDSARVTVARHYIGGPTLLADGEKLRQVFGNILDNANDALGSVAEQRRIELFIENGGKLATVRIRDNGCGIASDKLDRIFNPFFTTKEKGTGLGMAISKKIIEAHEGTIDVVSEPGRGAEFVVTLPLPSH